MKAGQAEAMQNIDEHAYDDILHLPHPDSPSHPRMARQDRAAQFAPFAALTGYDAAIQETARPTEKQREMGEEDLAALNEKLRILMENIQEHPRLTIVCFQPDVKKTGGKYVSVEGRVKKIRTYERQLVMEDGSVIPMDSVLEMEGDVFSGAEAGAEE